MPKARILTGDARFPFGARGEARVWFLAGPGEDPWDLWQRAREIPGVRRHNGGAAAPLDVASHVAALLGASLPPGLGEASPLVPVPGAAAFKAALTVAPPRAFQRSGAAWMARRAFGILADPMRSGKTQTFLMQTILLDALPTLILCPALAKWVWADEIARVTGESALILEGRRGDEARKFCITCRGRGRLPGNVRCPDCKAKNGQSLGARIVSGDDVFDTLRSSRWVIANYDILAGHTAKDGGGVEIARTDLQGWASLLAPIEFKMVGLDEAHLLRGRSTSKAAQLGQTRQDRINRTIDSAERVWAITGTPLYTRIAGLWPLLDIITRGNFGRPFHTFDVRYCGAFAGEYGWDNKGETVYAETELKDRMSHFMLRRPRSLILPNLPKKSRQVIRIEVDKRALLRTKEAIRKEANDDMPPDDALDGQVARELSAAFVEKLPSVVEFALNDLMESPRARDVTEEEPPRKMLVVTRHRRNLRKLTEAIEAAIGKRDVKGRIEEIGLKVFHVTVRVDQQTRFQMARSFREHVGAALFLATMDSIPGMISLKGAQTVVFAELHHSPSTMLQVEDRPYEQGIRGLSIVYMIGADTADEHVENLVLPKMELLDRIVGEEAANEVVGAFRPEEDQETIEEMHRRLTAHAV